MGSLEETHIAKQDGHIWADRETYALLVTRVRHGYFSCQSIQMFVLTVWREGASLDHVILLPLLWLEMRHR